MIAVVFTIVSSFIVIIIKNEFLNLSLVFLIVSTKSKNKMELFVLISESGDELSFCV